MQCVVDQIDQVTAIAFLSADAGAYPRKAIEKLLKSYPGHNLTFPLQLIVPKRH
jgi:hypothetical protein